MLTQLILTIGKARTFNYHLPPPLLAVFDYEKIAFIPYSEIQHFFYINDFDWKLTPSNKTTKGFKEVSKVVHNIIDNSENFLVFNYIKDDEQLREFIKSNFLEGNTDVVKVRIDKNNFIAIYNR